MRPGSGGRGMTTARALPPPAAAPNLIQHHCRRPGGAAAAARPGVHPPPRPSVALTRATPAGSEEAAAASPADAAAAVASTTTTDDATLTEAAAAAGAPAPIWEARLAASQAAAVPVVPVAPPTAEGPPTKPAAPPKQAPAVLRRAAALADGLSPVALGEADTAKKEARAAAEKKAAANVAVGQALEEAEAALVVTATAAAAAAAAASDMAKPPLSLEVEVLKVAEEVMVATAVDAEEAQLPPEPAPFSRWPRVTQRGGPLGAAARALRARWPGRGGNSAAAPPPPPLSPPPPTYAPVDLVAAGAGGPADPFARREPAGGGVTLAPPSSSSSTSSKSAALAPASASTTPPASDPPDLGTIWGLVVLGMAYVHHSTTGFAVPALLPLISPDLSLTDGQGALLTVGYTVLYACALIPVGFLADRADRPRLLAAGLALWSVATIAASKVDSFSQLLLLRVGFAAAQATQNPICFSLIPELFPRERNTAMAAYNSAIYVGRALSFAALIVAGKLGATAPAGADPPPDIGVMMVPLDKLDLTQVSLLYTQGDMAAITPIYDYDFSIVHSIVTQASWRQLLFWLGPPGLAIAALALLTLDEPRAGPGSAPTGDAFASSKFTAAPVRALARSVGDRFGEEGGPGGGRGGRAAGGAAAAVAVRSPPASSASASSTDSVWDGVRGLVASPAFRAITAAAAINDVGSWALVGWQATFYQRVYGLGPETYAPALAIILPVGGLLGGVGGGLLADRLSRSGGRYLLTAGATLAASPLLAAATLAPDYRASFAALLVGFGLSEMWRAPAAVMVRDVSPPGLGSTGSAVHLCVRNLLGGLGPLAVAGLAERSGLQSALLLVPTCYALSGVAFFWAERVLAAEKAAEKAAAKSGAA